MMGYAELLHLPPLRLLRRLERRREPPELLPQRGTVVPVHDPRTDRGGTIPCGRGKAHLRHCTNEKLLRVSPYCSLLV